MRFVSPRVATLIAALALSATAAVGVAPLHAHDEAAVAAGTPTVTVFKSPTCGCCKGWVEHLQKHGFKVVSRDLANVPQYSINAFEYYRTYPYRTDQWYFANEQQGQ